MRSASKKQLGPIGYLACGGASLAAAVAIQGWRAALAFGLAAALALAFYPSALRALRRRRFWLFTGMLVVSSALFITEEGPAWQGVAPSLYGLQLGLQMAFRAAAILVATRGIVEQVGISQLAALLERLGFGGLGFALGVALNALPVIGRTARNTLAALRLRGGFRRERLRALRQLLLTVVTNSLRYSGQVVVAAEARAYVPERGKPLPLYWSWADVALAACLLTAVVALQFL
ncbi:MAG: energy-coupling factor transporter transmembrane component T [Anaerolineae bacterium]|jgi:energy-coupling factor transporter transmembrane protein EcfT